MNRVLDQEDKILQIAVATRLDQILNSDFTEQEIREFEEQWQVPVLRIANVTGKRLADGRSLDGRAGVIVSVNITSSHCLCCCQTSLKVKLKTNDSRTRPGSKTG